MIDIFATTSERRQWSAGLRYAAQLAAWLDASLTAIHIPAPPIELPQGVSGALYSEFRDICLEEEEAARDFRAAFADRATRQGVRRFRAFSTEQTLEAALRAAAPWHHLGVLERPANPATAFVQEAGKLLLSVPLPLLLVSQDLPPRQTAPPTTIGIAWNGSIEALAAVHAALPLLQRASRVVLLRGVGPERAGPLAWHPRQEIEAYLSWQKVSVAETIVLADGEADTLFATSERSGVDLLVMGAYGRSRYAEWMFGGATLRALRGVNIPVLLRH